MLNKKAIIGLALVAGFGMSAAMAQVIPVPVVPIINTNDLIQVVPRGVPSGQSQYAIPAQINNVPGYVKTAVGITCNNGPFNGCAGYFNQFSQSQSYQIMVLTGTLAYSYSYTATSPSDGARECIVASGAGITAAGLVASGSQIVTGGSGASLSSNSAACWTYSASNLTWDRS